MKKIIFAALAVLVLCAGSAMAESELGTYTPRKGETLWGISYKIFGTGKLWHVIAEANGISDPRKMQAGKTLSIPEVGTIPVTNHRTSPYGAKAVQGDVKVLDAIDMTFYAQEVKDALKKRVLESPPSRYILMRGEEVDCVSDRNGIYCAPNGYQFAWKKIGALRADVWSETVDDTVYEVGVIEICGNFFARSREAPPSEPQEPILPVPEPLPEPIQPPVGEVIPPPVIIPEVPKEEIPPVEMRPCPECGPELEIDAGASIWVHDPRGNGQTTGKNIYAQVMYWENFEQDCSSEYWYGFGAIGSYYDYSASRFFSKGNGWRAAGQVGLKRNYAKMNKDGIELERSWQVKARLGWEESWWKNHQIKIKRWGPTYGPYVEYNHELIDESLKLVIQGEGWFGNSGSQTFVGTFVGVDWKFANRLTLRIGPGLDYQGWDKLYAFAPQAQVMYDLPNRNGRIAFGTYEKFYAHISPTFGLLGRYESGDLIKKLYGHNRRSEYTASGIGIGGNNNEPLSEEIAAEPEEIQSTAVEVNMGSSPRIRFDKNGESATMVDQAEVEFDRKISLMAWPNTQ